MHEEEKIYEVCWEGPYSKTNLSELTVEQNQKFVLYKIYGSHHLYGNNVLLYIGMTEQNVTQRMSQHDYWMDEEHFGKSKIYFGSVGKFDNWKKSEEIDIFDLLESETIKKVESLLIYAHQPVHNEKNRQSAEKTKNIRLFNTGNFGALMPEISGLYQDC
jgi:hypothetical protein